MGEGAAEFPGGDEVACLTFFLVVGFSIMGCCCWNYGVGGFVLSVQLGFDLEELVVGAPGRPDDLGALAHGR